MSQRPTLHDFIEDEMLRAPLLFDQVIDAVLEQWRQSRAPAARQGGDAARTLQNHRGDLVGQAVRSLRQHVGKELAAPRGPAADTAAPAPAKLELSLIDEDAVTSDIELSRAIERIKSMAEFELRELQAYAAALVGDLNVSRDHNPFRPEAYVRALWEGIQAVPLPRASQATLLHDLADPLARTLRQGYAAACTRLDDQGIEPAMHRTIVVTPTGRPSAEAPPPPVPCTLNELRDSLPMPLDELPPPMPGAASAAPQVDHQLVELLSRLFDAIQSDRALPPACLPLLLRLHPTALRLAVQDITMLDDYDHPVWRFMDQLAFVVDTVQDVERERCLGFARQLVEHLVADGSADSHRFEWALGRLLAFERHSYERALLLAQPEIDQLHAHAETVSPPIDIGTMDTVPAELLPETTATAPAPEETAALLALRPGDHLRAYLQGEWRQLQLLWVDRGAENWLLRDTTIAHHWALRLRAIERLFAERLAVAMTPRSLARAAAARVLRAMGTPLR